MKNTINARLFDRFRHVSRKMRMGRAPGMMTPGMEPMQSMPVNGSPSPMPAMHREMILIILLKRNTGMKQQDIADEIHVSKFLQRHYPKGDYDHPIS